jgi:hypothetical protein
VQEVHEARVVGDAGGVEIAEADEDARLEQAVAPAAAAP